MTCRMCNEQDNFRNGNSLHELCEYCVKHCCVQCFEQLKTDNDYKRHLCYRCYEADFFNLSKELYGEYKPEPKYFTFSHDDIADYEFECNHQKMLAVVNQRKIKIKKQQKKEQKKEQKKIDFERRMKDIEDDLIKPRIQRDNREADEEESRLKEIKYLKRHFGDISEEEIIIKINEEELLEGMKHLRVKV